MGKINEQEHLKTVKRIQEYKKNHGRKVKSLKEKYRRLGMQIIRILAEGKGTDGREKIIKPTIDKTFSKETFELQIEESHHIPERTNEINTPWFHMYSDKLF